LVNTMLMNLMRQ